MAEYPADNSAGNRAAGLPVVDVAPLVATDEPAAGHLRAVARQIEAACRDRGFFYVRGHGVPPALTGRLAAASRRFFALPEPAKREIEMARGGRAWRGYFPLGAELTSGRPDRKEGLYFGAEAGPDDPRVRAGVPLHGPNLFPRQVPELRPAVLAYLDALTGVGQALLRGIALSLGLEPGYFADRYTANPTVLFRIFHYPPAPAAAADWGVGEHTDYGLLTLLAQDEVGGLAVRGPGGWVDVPPLPGTLVCNLGDMLDRLTGGWYRSTLHRVRNTSGRDRLSFPFFLDPDFEAEVPPLPAGTWAGRAVPAGQRWDGRDLHRHVRRLPARQGVPRVPGTAPGRAGLGLTRVRARSGHGATVPLPPGVAGAGGRHLVVQTLTFSLAPHTQSSTPLPTPTMGEYTSRP
jgi:isopenicillin N synthase-like dioxygenase